MNKLISDFDILLTNGSRYKMVSYHNIQRRNLSVVTSTLKNQRIWFRTSDRKPNVLTNIFSRFPLFPQEILVFITITIMIIMYVLPRGLLPLNDIYSVVLGNFSSF
jgi:hypothetical protein